MRWPAPLASYRDKKESLGWHNWYAWYPVRIASSWYWLQTVKRRVSYVHGWRITSYQV